MDSGTSAADDPQTVVPFDLTLPNGKVFAKPGNFFHALLEPTIWGTDRRFVAPGGVEADLDRDGTVEFGDVLPDANVLVGDGQELRLVRQEERRGRPCVEAERLGRAHGARRHGADGRGLLGRVEEQARAIAGAGAKEKAFVAHSRLIDVHGILYSLQNVYKGVRPLVAQAGAAQSARIGTALQQLTRFVDGIYAQEKDRDEVHADAGRPPRQPGPEARQRDRRPDLAGRRCPRSGDCRPESVGARAGPRSGVRSDAAAARARGGTMLRLAVVAFFVVAAAVAGRASAADDGCAVAVLRRPRRRALRRRARRDHRTTADAL